MELCFARIYMQGEGVRFPDNWPLVRIPVDDTTSNDESREQTYATQQDYDIAKRWTVHVRT